MKVVENKLNVKVGDVFYNSWGYEQTNINFYQVTGLRGSTQILLRPISSVITKNCGFCSVMVKPVKDTFTGEEIRKTVKGTSENPYCNADYGFLHKTTWDKEHNETSYY